MASDMLKASSNESFRGMARLLSKAGPELCQQDHTFCLELACVLGAEHLLDKAVYRGVLKNLSLIHISEPTRR
eukprot:1024670-Lingulodinium_polyedra.AAC.1